MESSRSILIDDAYEFSAPMFYDFILGESEEEKRSAELWFESAISCAPSPVMLKIKTERQVLLDSLCEFNEADDAAENSNSAETSSNPAVAAAEMKQESDHNCARPEPMPVKTSKHHFSYENRGIIEGENLKSCGGQTPLEENFHKATVKTPTEDNSCKSADISPKQEISGQSKYASAQDISPEEEKSNPSISASAQGDICTPRVPTVSAKRDQAVTLSKQQQRAKRIAELVKNPSAMKSRNQSRLSQAKSQIPAGVQRGTNQKKAGAGTPNLAQENQAIKRQKLDDGKTRQILNVKPKAFPHKSRTGVASNNSTVFSSSATAAKPCKEDRKIYVREPPAPKSVAPFVSTAEMMRKFQSSTRDLCLPHSSVSNGKPMTLTRPKEPEFETSQRVRFTRVKSSAELEEEMMAKMPKFKARPLNKKILEASALPAIPRSNPKPPEFNEFHLETMSRASKNAEVSSAVSTESSRQWKPHHLSEPKTPVLLTSLRARPAKVKTSLEIEEEELEKIPKFKARPLNKKIFESKGNMKLFCTSKKQFTIPQEFHFAIDERIPPPQPSQIADLFDKLSLNSGSTHDDHYVPRNTRPNPFHLHTEERGAEKERRFVTELTHKLIEEERARIPKANPYPYTTDFPVVPPRPERKQCTTPEPFQLESLVRHEEELRREMEERLRKEREEAEMRSFKAQPVLKEDPIPLPEKERKPLTQVQAFNLHVEHRAVDRAEFDNKVKEKEMMYKRYREESDAAKMMEEEKALKQLRRTIVHHARPVPNFANPFIPQKSNRESTKAKSPRLRILQRRNHHRHSGSVSSASTISSSFFPSSAAPASMR